MTGRFSERIAGRLPEWLKRPLRLVHHPLYRLQVRVWCAISPVLDRFGPQPAGGVPVPPPLMRFKVGGTPSRRVFLETGRRSADNLLEVLHKAGSPFEASDLARVMDFGCGCGRTLAWLAPRFPEKRFWGSDVDRGMIRWCQANLHCAEFTVNLPEPPLQREDRSLDFIFAISVFTHLDETFQLRWLEEFRRLLSPGGGLLLTVHGEAVWSSQPVSLQEEVRRRGTVTTWSRKLRGLHPDWYQTTFHTRDHAERLCRRFFQDVSYWPGGMGLHDAVVCRKPAAK